MRVLLINSTWPHYSASDYEITVYTPEISASWVPLGLAYVAAYLRKCGHIVSIWDRNARFFIDKDIEIVDGKLIADIEDFKPEVIGISATTPLIEDAFHAAEIIKKKYDGLKIVLGGVHGTALPEETLKKCPAIDIVVRGEGEEIFRNLLEKLSDLSAVTGITYRGGKGLEIVHNPDAPLIENLDGIPHPARDLLDMSFYASPSTQIIFGYKIKGTSIVTSRGCPGRCNFCAGPLMSRNKVRFHSAEYTINELSGLVDTYGIEGVFFVDEMFTTDKARVHKICRLMQEAGLHKKLVWGIQLRADFVDEEILAIMRDSGCVQVEYGFESGSNKVLADMGKRLTVEQSIATSMLTKKVGIRQLANIIVGWPTETLDDLMRTVNFVELINPDFVSWHEYKPLPGSLYWDSIGDLDKGDFTKNKAFTYCSVTEQVKDKMRSVLANARTRYISNNANGLYIDQK